MFDTHTHLNHEDLYINRQEHLKDFIKVGWTGLINIWVNHEYNIKWIQICKSLYKNDNTPIIWDTDKWWRYSKPSYNKNPEPITRSNNLPYVYCTIGLHPYEVVTEDITDINMHHKIKQMCMLYAPYKEFIVGIWECGIDTNQPNSIDTLSVQKDLFIQQCDLARQRWLPIVIHSRSNWEATHDVLKDFTDLTIYFHCRSYSAEEIKIIKKTYPNFYIGFTGNITYPKATDIRKSLWYLVYENEEYPKHIINWDIESKEKRKQPEKEILSNILIETDAPYLSPQSNRGKTNTPSLIGETYKYISSLLGKDIESQIIKNAKKCYNL